MNDQSSKNIQQVLRLATAYETAKRSISNLEGVATAVGAALIDLIDILNARVNYLEGKEKELLATIRQLRSQTPEGLAEVIADLRSQIILMEESKTVGYKKPPTNEP